MEIEAGRGFRVLGFHDIAESALWQSSLTTLAVDPRWIGEEAASRLLGGIAHPDEPARQIILPPTLVIRQSCGHPEG
jgi:DNA-binding LacI/PurR family transcriptional regulator